MFNETCKLSNGVEIPKLGLGTWLLDNTQVAQAVRLPFLSDRYQC